MQLSTALCLCILILGLTGGLKPFQVIFHLQRFRILFFIVTVLALSRFTIAFNGGLHVNLGVVATSLLLFGWSWGERKGAGGYGALVAFACLAFFLNRLELLSGIQSGLLTGFIAGTAAVALARTPRTALSVISLVPLLCALLDACFALFTRGQTGVDLAQEALANGQMSGICFGSILLCLHAVALEERKTEG